MNEHKDCSADTHDAISAAHRLFDLQISRLARDIEQCKTKGQNRYVTNLSNQQQDWLRLKAGLPIPAQSASLWESINKIAAQKLPEELEAESGDHEGFGPDYEYGYEQIIKIARAAQPPAAPAPLMDAGSMFTFLRERMKDDTSASLIVACRALHDHLRVQAAPASPVETIDDVPSCGQENDYRRAKPATPVETECDTVKHMWGQVEKARADGTFSSPLSCSSAGTDDALTVDSYIAIWSMRPAPYSDEGKAWEAGARQGWRWAEQEAARLRAVPQTVKVRAALERIANPSTVSGMHDQDRAPKLQRIANEALAVTRPEGNTRG